MAFFGRDCGSNRPGAAEERVVTTELAERPIDLTALRPVLETAMDPVVIMRLDGVIADWNGRAEEVFGWSRAEAIGQRMADLIIPEELRRAHASGLERYLTTGKAKVLGERTEVPGLTRAGLRIPVELSISHVAVPGGTVFLGFVRDISDRRKAEEALRHAEARLRATREHAKVGIAESDAEGRFLGVNPAVLDITGYDRDELAAMSFLDLTIEEDRAEDAAAYGRQVRGELDTYALETRHRRKDGAIIWVSVTASAVRDRDGRFMYGIRVIQDVTDRRLAQDRQRLLLEELNHRVKNTLATVQSLAHQTARHSTDIVDFNRAFQSRLQAMSKTHELLTRERWEGASLREILENELKPYTFSDGSRVVMDGPPLRLNAASVVSLALVIHELATNAAKYGALSAGGQVEVVWTAEDPASGGCVELVWRETGGPPVTPPAHRGFGSKLIERVVGGDLGGRAEVDYRAEGLQARLAFRLAAA
jgi:PAS domain S-box-containing protein